MRSLYPRVILTEVLYSGWNRVVGVELINGENYQLR